MPLLRRRQTESGEQPAAPHELVEADVFETPEELLLRLDFTVLRRLHGLLQGAHRTLSYGSGLDFADLREYQLSDDVRHIDWNVTARLDEPFVRTFHEDRDATVWLLVDCSGSMSFGPSGHTKHVAAAEITTALARLATQRGNRVGAIFFDNDDHMLIPPATGRRHVVHLARCALRAPGPPSGTTSLARLLELGRGHIRRRSAVFVVSDFLSVDDWSDQLGWLGHRHDVSAVHVIDPREGSLPDAGIVTLVDAETGEQIRVDTSDAHVRRRVDAAVLERGAALDAALRTARVARYELSTEGELIEVLVEVSHDRKRPR